MEREDAQAPKGAPFDEDLYAQTPPGSNRINPGKTIRHLVEELQTADGQIKRLESRLREAEAGHRSAAMIAVAFFLLRCFGLWALFHLGLWSWNQQPAQSLGQQSYQYLDAAIKAGVLPNMSEVQKRIEAARNQPAAPQPQK